MARPDHLLPQRERQRAEQRRALDKIDHVIEITIVEIEKHGVDAINMRSIAAGSGVSYGSIYHHFGDRDGLIQAAQFERLRRQPGIDIASFQNALDQQGSLDDFVVRIQKIADDIADPARAHVRLERASVITSSLSRPELRKKLTDLEDDIFCQVRDLVARAQELGIADPSLDPAAAAIYLEALSFGVVLAEFVHDRPDPAALSAVLFRGFAALLAPPTP
jgi:AcrR family transcriptional regulator